MGSRKDIRILSRGSALAVTQAELVAQALSRQWPAYKIHLATRTTTGDRDRTVPLWQTSNKGVFTQDLSDALLTDDADLVVHSWKDLPIDDREETRVVGTLERADLRDVLLLRAAAVAERPGTLTVLTSSPRRAWQLDSSLRPLLPWTPERLEMVPVRGNVPTRLAKLAAGEAHGLVVAKAALDRLLGGSADAVRSDVRARLADCRWMVLPLREFPSAPAQGALAIEAASARPDLAELVDAISHPVTAASCEAERNILRSHGGGCHEALGATVLQREYGTITSVRGRLPDGQQLSTWTLTRPAPPPPKASRGSIWPAPGEEVVAERIPLGAPVAPTSRGWWVARAEALPERTTVGADTLLWTTGTRTWTKLAARGHWVNGCADSLGDQEPPNVDVLAGEPVRWQRLTHDSSDDLDAIATYRVRHELPADLAERSHFFWTSGRLFLDALERFPAIASGWHASGPGRTSRVIRERLPRADRISIWLDYQEWLQNILQ